MCNFCRKPGHVFKDCFLRLGKEKVGYKNQKSSNAFLSAYISGEANDTDWFVDSGATEHMCCNKEMFATYRSLHVQWSVKIGDGSEIFALGVGSVKIKAFNGNQWVDSVIENVLYVPALKLNLFSVCAVTDKGYNLVSNSKECRFEKDNEVKCIGIREGKLYKMMFRLKYRYENSAHVSVEITKTRLTLKEWHEKLAHQHAAQVRKILLKHGIDFVDEFFFCEACTKGKQHRLPFPSSKTKTERPCELIHADLAGPMEVASLGGSRYFLLLKDDVSHYRTVYFLKNKNQVQGQLEIFLNKVENETGSKVKILRTDNGLEFVNREVQKLLQDRGVAHQRTVHYTPEQNGKAEREMRTIVEAARTVLQARNLNKEMWAEAVHYVTYILNNSGTSEVQGKFPTEVWSGKPVSKEIIENFHVFGSEVWVHIPKQKRLKWDPKSECCIFVGYDLNTKGYRVFYPKSRKIDVVRDVVFRPERIVTPEGLQTDQNVYRILSEGTSKTEISGDEQVGLNEEVQEMEVPVEPVTENEVQHRRLRSRETIKAPSWLSDYETAFVSETDDPTSVEEAMQSKEANEWKKAMQEELKTLQENNTWTVVEKPEERDVVECKWVFKKKISENGPTTYKARLVARGFQQKFDSDPAEIYAPVVKLNTVRILLAVANKLRLPVYQMDVKGAFLNGDMKEEEVFLVPPKSFECKKNSVLKLNKSIYGLKKSPRIWNDTFNKFLMKEGYVRSKNDYCLYIKTVNEKRVYLLLFVDDVLILGTEEKLVEELKQKLTKSFQMKDLGRVSNYLGINIRQDLEQGVTTLNQTNYLKNVLKRFNMEDCKPVSTPMEPNFVIQASKKSESHELENKCRQIIGSLMYAMVATRPDLSVPLSILSRYQNCATKSC